MLEFACFYLNGVSPSAQMGIRFCRHRRPLPSEPEPEENPATDPSDPGSHSSSESTTGEQEVETGPVTPGVVAAVPVTLELPPESENYRLTLVAPGLEHTAEAGFRFYAVWVIPYLANQRLFAGVH